MNRIVRFCMAAIAVMPSYGVGWDSACSVGSCYQARVVEVYLDSAFPSSFQWGMTGDATYYPCKDQAGNGKAFVYTGTSFENTKGVYALVLAAYLSQKALAVWYSKNADGTCQVSSVLSLPG